MRLVSIPVLTFLTFSSMQSCQTDTAEKQITHDLTYHHDLDNNDNFSPNGQWLVYDTRTDDGGIAESARIERVNIETGEKQVLFDIKNNQVWGPGAGAVSYSPKEHAVVFIHGLANSTKENPYQQWRRTGVIIHDDRPNVPVYMDARDVTPPFTPGALRGGTHRHEWSGDGQWIGFTYNDAILKALEDSTGQKHNLRTIGVSKKVRAVKVDENPENVSGEWFSALVVRVVPNPAPGSDEISHAASDSWVGMKGYATQNGTQQVARAFLGTVKDKAGNDVPEVFIVDIPNDITQPGPLGPLEGTGTDFPMPPKGTVQRRLTFTANTAHPGCSGIVRTSPDGSQLAFFAKDANGISQIFTISPDGGQPRQITEYTSDITGNLRWHPDGKHITYVYEGSIVLCGVNDAPFEERTQVLTEPSAAVPGNLVWSADGKRLAFNRRVKSEAGKSTQQVFVLSFEKN
jgi:WD40 repeat protein